MNKLTTEQHLIGKDILYKSRMLVEFLEARAIAAKAPERANFCWLYNADLEACSEEVFCYPCASRIRELYRCVGCLPTTESDLELLDSDWQRSDTDDYHTSDGAEACARCGAKLLYALTDYGIKAELDEIGDDETLDWWSMVAIAEGLQNSYRADFYVAFLALVRKAVPDFPSTTPDGFVWEIEAEEMPF